MAFIPTVRQIYSQTATLSAGQASAVVTLQSTARGPQPSVHPTCTPPPAWRVEQEGIVMERIRSASILPWQEMLERLMRTQTSLGRMFQWVARVVVQGASVPAEVAEAAREIALAAKPVVKHALATATTPAMRVSPARHTCA